MATSTAISFHQEINTIDNSGTGAGQMWNDALYQIFHALFTTAEAVDAGRWRLVDHSLALSTDWNTKANVVDNSWFVVEAYAGRRKWQAKFQASNVVVVDENPPWTTYTLIVSLSSDGGWNAKGFANGGFTNTSTPFSGNMAIAGTNITGSNGSIVVHSDRDTVLIAGTNAGNTNWSWGAYVGRFTPDNDRVVHPECVLTSWVAGVGTPNGFDRTAGGVFASSPTASACWGQAATIETVNVWTSEWLTSTYEPNSFSEQYHYRPLEITSVDAYIGQLRLVWACGGLISKSRLDTLQKLVLCQAGVVDDAVCIAHNGTSI